MPENTHTSANEATQLPSISGGPHSDSRSAGPLPESSRRRWGFRVMAAVLLVAAGLKTMSLVFPTRWLDQPNAIFPFTERWVLVFAVAVDIGVAFALLSRKSDYKTKLVIGGWLLGVFALYRGGLYLLGNPKHCGCVGDPSAWWPWLTGHGSILSTLMWVVLFMAFIINCITNTHPRQGHRP